MSVSEASEPISVGLVNKCTSDRRSSIDSRVPFVRYVGLICIMQCWRTTLGQVYRMTRNTCRARPCVSEMVPVVVILAAPATRGCMLKAGSRSTQVMQETRATVPVSLDHQGPSTSITNRSPAHGINLSKKYKWKISPRTRFNFHLEGSTMHPDSLQPSEEYLQNPWSDPVRSDRLGMERTPTMAAESLRLLRQ